MIFRDAETADLEEDARLTAMYLWTLAAPSVGTTQGDASTDADEVADDGPNDQAGSEEKLGFVLEYDAARKIAQGLGARLEALDHVVEVRGDKARLRTVRERARFLLGHTPSGGKGKRKERKQAQMSLLVEVEQVADAQGWGTAGAPKAGATTLDRVHQAMLLFGAGRGEAVKRFLVEDGVGAQTQFWKLAQALSALYPTGSDEKRWVDGVLARKKGLGFG